MSAGETSGGKFYTLILIITAILAIVIYGFWSDSRFTGKMKRRK